MAQDISEQLSSDNIINELTNEEFLDAIYGVGEKSVESITDFFNKEDTRKIFEQLKNYGVNVDPKKYSDHIDADNTK